MANEPYAMVRGSVLRVTGLSQQGALPLASIRRCVSKSITRIEITEITNEVPDDVLRGEQDDLRLVVPGQAEVLGYTANIDFLHTDPEALSLLTSAPLHYDGDGQIVGFTHETRLPATAFALEVWSRLSGPCRDGRRWGHTLVPFLRGGYLSGFSFENGLVSFSVHRARSIRGAKWSAGPYDIFGPWQRTDREVNRDTTWRNVRTPMAPPAPTNGITYFTDIIDGGSASLSTDDVIDGGTAAVSTPWIIDGGI